MSGRHQYAEGDIYVCPECTRGDCTGCTDIERILRELPPTCQCKADGHAGEPRSQQIADPLSGDVHAPGLVVHEDGHVTFLSRRSE